MSIEQGVRQDDTWIAVDPILGCAKDCQYCFLQTYNQTPRKGEIILESSIAIDNLLAFPTYRNESVIMLASETDAFMSRSNIEYYSNFLKEYDLRAVGNTIALVTKCHVPDSFIELVKNLKNTRILFYLSYSGLSKPIEPTTNIQKLRENFVRLSAAGLDVIHYWRPFLPQNSSPEKMREVIDHVAKYARCSVVSGLKVNPGILEKMGNYWPELYEATVDLNTVEAIWPKGVQDYLHTYINENHPNYPIFWTNSCAISYVQERPEFNGIYGSHSCVGNHCPESQRAICSLELEDHIPTEDNITAALEVIQVTAPYSIDSIKREIVIEAPLTHAQIIYLRQELHYSVKSSTEITSTNEWAGAALGRQLVEVPFNTKNFDLTKIWDTAVFIRTIFKDVERIEWDAETYLMELMVQVGHLSDVILRQTHKLNFQTSDKSSEILADEISDVILNIFSIADHCGISLLKALENSFALGRYELLDGSYLYKYLEVNFPEVISPFDLCFELLRNCSNISLLLNDSKDECREVTQLASSLLISFFNALRIADYYAVNLDASFSQMLIDSQAFIKKNSLDKQNV